MIPCRVEPPRGHRIPFGWERGLPAKGSLSEINSGDPLFYIKDRMTGVEEAVFHVNIIDQLDNVFLYDGMKFLSRKQERFFSLFFKYADIITRYYQSGNNIETNEVDYSKIDDMNIVTDENSSMSLEEIDPVFIKLDHFLGNYKGVDENEYTR